MAEILGVDPETATYDDVEKLSRKDKMQLFYAAHTPDVSEINGEYDARLLSGGILGPSSALFTHHMFPTGRVTPNTAGLARDLKLTATGPARDIIFSPNKQRQCGFHPAHPAHADIS